MVKDSGNAAVDLAVGDPDQPGRRARRARKPRIDKMITEVEKAGKVVTSVTTSDGITLRFGEPTPAQQSDLDKWMAKRHAH